jgi:hypothetical protein
MIMANVQTHVTKLSKASKVSKVSKWDVSENGVWPVSLIKK